MARKTRVPARPIPEMLPDGLALPDIDSWRPDEFGREAFTVYWSQDKRWAGGGLVAAQCFFTSLTGFAERWLEQHPDGAVACRLPVPGG